MGDDDTKVFHLSLLELALVQLQEQLVFAQEFQDSAGYLPVLLDHLGEDKNIVKVNHHHSLCDEVLKYFVHQGLERGRAVGEAKEHDQGPGWCERQPSTCLSLSYRHC
jgi:hypothetical protein